jgi:chromosome segregation ATPase
LSLFAEDIEKIEEEITKLKVKLSILESSSISIIKEFDIANTEKLKYQNELDNLYDQIETLKKNFSNIEKKLNDQEKIVKDNRNKVKQKNEREKKFNDFIFSKEKKTKVTKKIYLMKKKRDIIL